MVKSEVPDGLPILSRGKHRNPRKGACFMEMASVLANERWSDHPKCTHPLLGQLARLVNDHTTDRHRGDLVLLVPSVVGVRGGGVGWMVDLTAAVALHALPDVPASAQRALVAGLVRCDEIANRLGPGAVERAGVIRQTLADQPDSVAWAKRFADGRPLKAKAFEERSAPSILLCAVRGLVDSSLTNAESDARLRRMLEMAIETARRLEPQPSPVGPGFGSTALRR